MSELPEMKAMTRLMIGISALVISVETLAIIQILK